MRASASALAAQVARNAGLMRASPTAVCQNTVAALAAASQCSRSAGSGGRGRNTCSDNSTPVAGGKVADRLRPRDICQAEQGPVD